MPLAEAHLGGFFYLCDCRPVAALEVQTRFAPTAQVVGFFYLRTMKPNTTQLAAIETCIDALQCLTSTNDINSPTHYVDTEAEVDKLELPTDDESTLASKLCELIAVIRKLK